MIANIGVFYDNAFPANTDYFSLISQAHQFSPLTESDKPSVAFRKGVYLTPVNSRNDGGGIKFNLLRCSANMHAPTEAFRPCDSAVVACLNQLRLQTFPESAEFNHVLAQIYTNPPQIPGEKCKKAKIKAHSDKTKDMPGNALIAFCSFYDRPVENPAELTKLRFRAKSGDHPPIDVLLRPNSVLIIDLETNRLYTHEIVPSTLPVAELPTRMGYVVRCSNTRAVFKDGQTFISANGVLTPLHPTSDADLVQMRALYYAENTGTDIVHYGDTFFSMNSGDYLCPVV